MLTWAQDDTSGSWPHVKSSKTATVWICNVSQSPGDSNPHWVWATTVMDECMFGKYPSPQYQLWEKWIVDFLSEFTLCSMQTCIGDSKTGPRHFVLDNPQSIRHVPASSTEPIIREPNKVSGTVPDNRGTSEASCASTHSLVRISSSAPDSDN